MAEQWKLCKVTTDDLIYIINPTGWQVSITPKEFLIEYFDMVDPNANHYRVIQVLLREGWEPFFAYAPQIGVKGQDDAYLFRKKVS
jgi:hypothetical protein